MKQFFLIVILMIGFISNSIQTTYSQSNAAILDATALANDTTPEKLRIMGYESIIYPELSADRLHEIAIRMLALNQVDRDKLKTMQKAFQDALMQFTFLEDFIKINRNSIEEVDNALETVFNLEDIKNGYEWNSLAYVYGYFNHDVTVEEIQQVSDGWDKLSEEEKAKQFPTYVHLIDAVVKPLAYWEQPSKRKMLNALDVGMPLLNKLLMQKPAPGTAFHAPSHALIILGDLYMRWEEGTKYWEKDSMYISRPSRHIGAKPIMGRKLNEMCIGSLDNLDSISKEDYRFYAVREQYIANTLVRLFWRNNGISSEYLNKSLKYYQKQGNADKTIHALKRALVALNDPDMRKEFEANPLDHVEDFVWIIRNGKHESVEYAEKMLAQVIGCPVDKAVELYYKQRISDEKRRMNANAKDQE